MEDRFYRFWRPAFAEVMDPRFYTLEWLDAEISEGRAKFWSNDQGAIVATLRTYPGGAVEVHGLIAAGDLTAIKALIPLAEHYGCENGAIVASIASRAAWSRALASSGYDLHQVELRKDISGGNLKQ